MENKQNPSDQKFSMQNVLEKLKELGIRPNKKLGQNFLVNVQVCKRIVEASLKNNPSKLIEVGPGLGALTDLLLEQSVPVTLIELDRTFCEYWNNKNANVIQIDALKLDWGTLENPPNTTLVSNLPYQISSSIVIDRSIEPYNINHMVLMFQKEVGMRMMAKHKTPDYGLLTVIAQTFWKVEHLMDVGPKDFYPPPQIASRVIVFSRSSTQMENPQKYLSLVKKAFSQRRKFMISNLSQLYTREVLSQAFAKIGIKETVRSEDLTVAQFIDLYNCLRGETHV
jgi:16S rRNA (adenine1518-N6/adenine1519-N6)-dimethyltransferase